MNHPPRPQLAFRVGIVGHRPNRLGSADLPSLSGVVGSILMAVKANVEEIGSANRDIYSDEPPVLRAVSPLAEGSDRIFAEQALNLGYDLSCPMPYFQAEYEKDFLPGVALEPDSLERFRGLLERAATTGRLVRFEQEGSRAVEAEAFRNNAQIVLNQSDLLLFIWDGHYHDKPGGTEETLSSARIQQVPIIWIDACAPHDWQIIRPGERLPEKAAVKRHIPRSGVKPAEIQSLVSPILAIPSGAGDNRHGAEQRERLIEFYNESQPRWNFALLWKYFRNLLGANRLKFLSPRIALFEKNTAGEASMDAASSSDRQAEWLRRWYSWPDGLADNYADRYRSGFLLTFLLASLAVGVALFPLVTGGLNGEHHGGTTVFTLLEAAVICTILGLVFFSRKSRWHGRWLDYRMTAESVRQLKLFLPLGGGKPFPQMAAHLTQYGNPSATWMTWYVQAIERLAGLPSVKADRNHLRNCLKEYAGLLAEQEEYHGRNAGIYEKLEHRLHKTGELTLWLTLCACLLHLVPVIFPQFHLQSGFGNTLTFLCGFLPALGASMAGINHQGEFKRIAKNSMGMEEQLSVLALQTETLLNELIAENETTDSLFLKITDLSREIANLMINEVSDWKVVYQDRPPVLPA